MSGMNDNVDSVVVPGTGPVFICQPCLRGEHISYGFDHRLAADGVHAGDCKTLSPDGKRQCACVPEWTELHEAIRRHNRDSCRRTP